MRRMYPYILLVALDCEHGETLRQEILIFGWVLAFFGSGVNRVTVDFGADINNELSCRTQAISVMEPVIMCSSSGI